MVEIKTSTNEVIERLQKEAFILYQNAKLAESKKICDQILKISPVNVVALEISGVHCLVEKRFHAAVAVYTKLTTVNPKSSNAYVNRGLALKALGEFDLAIQSFDVAISLSQKDAKAYYNRANALVVLKKFDSAVSDYKRAIVLDPNFVEAYANLGGALTEDMQYSDALHYLDKAVSLNPANDSALYNQGKAFHKIGRYEEAMLSYDRAIALNSSHFEATNDKGLALHELQNYDEALNHFNRTIVINPHYAQAYSNRGNTLNELKRLDEALASYNKAIELKPDFAQAYNNRGNTLNELNRLDEALASYNKAIELKPDFAKAHGNCSIVLMKLARYEDALASCDKAIALKANYAEAYFYKSLCLLLKGQFSEGWELYEWRWKMELTPSKPLLTDRSAFNLKDRKRVLVWAEQGVGDHLMFGSMISEFKHLCAQLIVQLDERLIPLFSRSIPNDVLFLPTKSPVPQDFYDQHIPIGSISRYLRNNEESFATARSGYLRTDCERTNEIRKFLTNGNRKRICGISWRSKGNITGGSRSIKLNNFLQFVFMKDFSFVNLQYGETGAEIEQARTELGIEVINYDKVDNFNDLDGLACLIQSCDVVVSIDNSTVHLAGALGKDVRVLLPRTPEWRWQLVRDDNPWYSSATLYRQSDDGDWTNAFAKIRADLQKYT